jgi:hypothetical protein
MIKKESYILGLTLLVVVISSGFIRQEEKKVKGFHLEEYEIIKYHVANEYESEDEPSKGAPFLGKSFNGFAKKMAYKESRGQIHLVNPFGYMGKYQFGKSALRTVGIYDYQQFLLNEDWQDKAFEALISRNKWELRKEIKKYAGKTINGVEISESGIVAAAHLGGASSVKKYLKSNGLNTFKDGFGTSIATYIKKFANYNTSHIKADVNAKVNLVN